MRVFNSLTQRNFSCIPGEVGDLSILKCELAMFHGHLGNPLVDTGEEKCSRVEGGHPGLVGPGVPEAADRYRQARRAVASVVAEAKTRE